MMTRISVVCFVCVFGLACGCGSRSGLSAAKKGMAALRDGHNEKAIAYFTAATERNPSSPELYYHLGLAHLKQGNIEPAQKAFQMALDLEPAELKAHVLGGLGQVAFHQKEYARAFAALGQALQIAPDDETRVRVLATMGIVETYCQNYSLARLHYLRALHLDQKYAPARYNLSVLYQDQYGLVAEALDEFGMFLHSLGEKDTNRRDIAEKRIVRLRAKLDQAVARTEVRRNATRAATLLEDGKNAQASRQYPRAIAAYKSALAADPLAYEAAYELGRVYRLQGMRAEALEAFKKASELYHPMQQECSCQAAELALQLRQPAEALMILNQAIARSPYNPAALKLAALAYQAEAQIPEAIAYGEFYLSIAPGSEPDRAAFEQRIQALKQR